jgi:hypothetical protein
MRHRFSATATLESRLLPILNLNALLFAPCYSSEELSYQNQPERLRGVAAPTASSPYL